MATDNPVLEPADVFYGTTEEAEPKEPTEPEAVTNGDDPATEEKTLETDHPEQSEIKDESEGAESEEEPESTENEDEELTYLELDGKEVDLNEVRQWRDGHLMQSDYTRKTTEVAEDRKALKAEREEVSKQKAGLIDLQAELQALVEEDEAVDWKELREIDPEEYIAKKEKADKRKAAVKKLKSEASKPDISQDDLAKEQQSLFDTNPGWLDDKGEQTKEMKDDKKRIEGYWEKHGFTAEDVSGMRSARYINACLKAAKYDELQEKSKAFAKKAKKATLVTKPKSQVKKVKTKPKALEEVFYNS
jgi:hypothetical protein